MERQSELPRFSAESYHSWKLAVEMHILNQHEDMIRIMHEGPIKVDKTLAEWSREEKKLHQLDYLARDIIASTLDVSMLAGISRYNSAKEMIDHLNRLSTQPEQILPDGNDLINMEEGASSSSPEDKGHD